MHTPGKQYIYNQPSDSKKYLIEYGKYKITVKGTNNCFSMGASSFIPGNDSIVNYNQDQQIIGNGGKNTEQSEIARETAKNIDIINSSISVEIADSQDNCSVKPEPGIVIIEAIQ